MASFFIFMMIQCKSVYDKPHPNDGLRVYVDRLWPEGLSTRQAAVTEWLQDLAPSYELWRHGYDLEQWPQYRQRYREELSAPDKRSLLESLLKHAREGPLTLLYGTSDGERNNAVVVKEMLESRQS